MMGVKLKTNVWRTKIHFPFCEVGLNRQSPLEISWVADDEFIETLLLTTTVVLVILAEETEKKSKLLKLCRPKNVYFLNELLKRSQL